MKILVERLTADPEELQFEGDSAWWRSFVPPDHALPSELPEPFRIALRAHRMGEVARLRAQHGVHQLLLLALL